MTLPSPSVIRAANAANDKLADRATPFIFNEWYVAAFSDEIENKLFSRRILERQIVFFRAESGAVVALDDRCVHRSLPLSRGTLEHDSIVCGYHGFRYDIQGNCIDVPSQDNCPAFIGVRKYPLREQGGLVWIWMGDEPAHHSVECPDPEWLRSERWARSKGYFNLKANYVSLHENLLDLTHLSYVHAKSFGTPDYARAPYQVYNNANTFAIERAVVPTLLPPVWGKTTGLDGCATAARIARSEFLSPAFHCVNVRFYDNALLEECRPQFEIRTAHLPTPETQSSTHYFIVHGRDFALDDPSVTQFMHEQLFIAFQEDVETLEALEPALAERGDGFFELSVASDAPSIAMRRHLKARADTKMSAGEE